MFSLLHGQISAAGIPVVSVGGKATDRSTWRVDFAPEATDEQKAQASQIVAAFDVEKAEHNAGINRQIVALEAQRPGYVRGVREFMLGVSQIVAQIPGAPNLMQTPGMQNVKALDDQIKALRAQRQ